MAAAWHNTATTVIKTRNDAVHDVFKDWWSSVISSPKMNTPSLLVVLSKMSSKGAFEGLIFRWRLK